MGLLSYGLPLPHKPRLAQTLAAGGALVTMQIGNNNVFLTVVRLAGVGGYHCNALHCWRTTTACYCGMSFSSVTTKRSVNLTEMLFTKRIIKPRGQIKWKIQHITTWLSGAWMWSHWYGDDRSVWETSFETSAWLAQLGKKVLHSRVTNCLREF